MPKAPPPPEVTDLLRRPNPAVVAVLLPSGAPMSVATWYLLEDDGTVLLNMDAERARVSWMRRHPEVALTAIDEADWYTHVSIRGRVVRWETDPARALADIDRLARHYTGRPYAKRDRPRVSCWVEVEHWHGWGAADPARG